MRPRTTMQPSGKKAVNLTANAELVAKAKENKLNLSEIFEEAILIKLRTIQQKEWLDNNKTGIDAYNKRIEQNGLFASKFRRF